MRIVFWQNCLSPHQLPYIVHLMDDKRVDEVVVVTEESISDERKKMGWELGCYPQIEKCSIIISPNNDKIRALFNMREADSWHLFSGIHGFPFIFHCFKISLVYNIKRGIVTECPYTYAFGSNNGKPLWLHSIRFFLQDYKYAKYIDKVFAMGNRATKYFKSVYSKWNVYPFMYCTQPKEKNNLIT
ncbi:glycosyltransferase family 1 protein, partial [Phocaeicola vulgatus]|nr:glycosyltransferase family 1 protein [Phocaeicola vulgatus]